MTIVETNHGTDVTSNAASITVQLPDGSNAIGRRIIACVVKDGSGAVTWPVGWNTINEGLGDSSAIYLSVYYRDVDGSEGYPDTGATITCSGGSEEWAAYSILFEDHDPDTPPESSSNTGATASPTWPTLSPTWGPPAEETDWICFGGWDGEPAHGAFPVPTDFTVPFAILADNTGGASNGVTHCAGALTETTLSQSPGSSTMGASSWYLVTVAVRPEVVAAPVSDIISPTQLTAVAINPTEL